MGTSDVLKVLKIARAVGIDDEIIPYYFKKTTSSPSILEQFVARVKNFSKKINWW